LAVGNVPGGHRLQPLTHNRRRPRGDYRTRLNFCTRRPPAVSAT
jgi:hypothetical protein